MRRMQWIQMALLGMILVMPLLSERVQAGSLIEAAVLSPEQTAGGIVQPVGGSTPQLRSVLSQPADATAIELPYESEELSISIQHEQDAFVFELDAEAWVLVDVNANELGSALDAVLSLRDAAGLEIASNDDTDGRDPRLEVFLQPGPYTVIVSGYDTSTGFYRLRVSSSDQPTQGGSRKIITLEIELPYASEELTADAGTISRFSFELAGRSILSADINAERMGSSIDMALELLNAQGETIAANDDTNGLDPRIQEFVNPGRYTLVVHVIEGAGAYRLSVSADELLVSDEFCQESTLRPINFDSWILGTFDPGRQIQVLLEFEPGSLFSIVLQEVISEAPSLALAVAQTTVFRSPGLLIYDVPGDMAKTYLVQILAITGNGHYRMCWAPTSH